VRSQSRAGPLFPNPTVAECLPVYTPCQNDLSLSAMPPPVCQCARRRKSRKRNGAADPPLVGLAIGPWWPWCARTPAYIMAASAAACVPRGARARHAPAAPALPAAAGAPRHRGADEEPAGTRRSVLERPRPCLERNARFHASVEREELLVVVSLGNVVAPRCVAQPGRRRAVASRTRQYAL